MEQKRILKVVFQKSGSGSINSRLCIPITWIRQLGITEEDRNIEVSFNGSEIIIKKARG